MKVYLLVGNFYYETSVVLACFSGRDEADRIKKIGDETKTDTSHNPSKLRSFGYDDLEIQEWVIDEIGEEIKRAISP